jgi:adenylate cyclase
MRGRAGTLARVGSEDGLPAGVLARRLAACAGIVLLAWVASVAIGYVPVIRDAIPLADNVFYDEFYRARPVEDQNGGDVVIVAVNDASLAAVSKTFGRGWPWPREFWGYVAGYVSKSGAKAVCFDLLFSEASEYNKETGDDDTFADAIKAIKTPVVFGSQIKADGSWGNFAPAIPGATFGAVNVGQEAMYRRYEPSVEGKPSLAVAALRACGESAKLDTNRAFLLRYYGPYLTAGGGHTFRYVSAAEVLAAALPDAAPGRVGGITPEVFKGKIVLIGAISTGTFDLKSSPLSEEYPGVEVQATAIENLLRGQEVLPLGEPWTSVETLVGAMVAAIGVTFPRRVGLKILAPVAAVAIVIGVSAALFVGAEINWLAPTQAVVATAVATVGAFAWTYFAEDRQRRFMLKALSKVVSPAVAQQLAREPGRLARGTVRLPITVLFTDLANFTDLSESMDVQKLGELLNRYLGEISDQVLAQEGTLDKYIGDALMCFWNAPLPQEDHAIRACAAALAIARREKEIIRELTAFGARKIFTRIGINSTDAAVGFVGSSHLFNYTALGDGVNLASRLEGANKIYGTRILISQSTAERARGWFAMRKIDVLRVKGKTQPIAVYELIGKEDGEAGELIAAYERAFEHYQSRRWEEAEKELLQLLGRFAEDGAGKVLLERVRHLRENPPSGDWDGVYQAKEK